MACFVVWPILVTVREAFIHPTDGFTFGYFWEIFRNPLYLEGLWNSLKMAIGSTLGSILIALPLAVLSTRYEFWGKRLLTSLLLVPLVLPPFVGVIGIKEILGQQGALNSLLMHLGIMNANTPVDWLGNGRLGGVIILNSLHLYPIMFLNISASLANIDPAMDEAAANLGASPWRRFRRITLPLAMPGIFAGASIVFIWGFTELGVPLMFDYSRVTSVQIFDGIKDIGGNPLPYALVVVMLLACLTIFFISKRVLGRHGYTTSGRAAMVARTRPLSGYHSWLAASAFLSVIFLAAQPHLGVLFRAIAGDWDRTVLPSSLTLAHYRDALSHPLTVPSIQNSLLYAGVATIIDIILGTAIAWVCVRTKLRGRAWLDAMAMLPLAVPGLVLAFGYLAMTREGQAFDFLLPSSGHPFFILVIAYAMRRLPYVVRSATAGLQQVNPTLEEAAQNLGCSPLRAILKVTLPLIAANLIAGGLLSFSFSMLEVSDSMILAQKREHFPVTKAIYELAGNLGNGEALAAALGVWAMVFLTVSLIGSSVIMGRKMGALFKA